MRVPYTFVEAFTQSPLMGNPIAIVPRAEMLDEPTMQRIAGELDQVATTFILPPKSDLVDWSLRSFTTSGKEVLGAGLNSLSAWWWLAESGGLTLSEGRDQFTQEIGGECLPVDGQQLKRLLQEVDGEGCYLYCLDDSESASSIAHARFFNPGLGVVEEAATGTAAVPLACLLFRYGIARNRKTLLIEQGYEMKCPCVLEIEVEDDVSRLTGRAITVKEGTLWI